MARNYEECKQMIDVCNKENVPLFVAYYRRALPNTLKVKEIINTGVIGDVRFVNIKLQMPLKPYIIQTDISNDWRVLPEISGGGYFFDLASHQLDIMDFIFGTIEKAKGFSLNQAGVYPADDITTATFIFKNGILGIGIWAFNTSDVSAQDITTIVGSKGLISFPFFDDNSVTLEIKDSKKEIFQFNITKNIQQPLIQTIVSELLGSGKCPSTGVSGARTNWVMKQIC